MQSQKPTMKTTQHKKARAKKINHALDFYLTQMIEAYTKNPINFNGIVSVSDVNFKTNGAKHFRSW